MGIQKDIKLRGTWNGIIYYQSRGMDLVRSTPLHVKQTDATKAQAGIFGQGSHLGGVLRMLLKPVLPATAHGKERHKFDEVIRSWLRTGALHHTHPQNNIDFINGYQFNGTTAVYERLKKKLVVSRGESGGVVVDIPSLVPVADAVAPVGTLSVTMKIMAATSPVTGSTGMANAGTELHFPYNAHEIPARQVLLPVTPVAGNITVVVLAVQYHTTANATTAVADQRWTPVGIIAAMYD